ncbi:hypothetical protein VPH1254_0027 [Vibrio phage 1254]
MDESDLLIMMRRLSFTHSQFAIEIGVSTRTFDRYIASGVPKRIINAANWVYFKEIGREYRK